MLTFEMIWRNYRQKWASIFQQIENLRLKIENYISKRGKKNNTTRNWIDWSSTYIGSSFMELSVSKFAHFEAFHRKWTDIIYYPSNKMNRSIQSVCHLVDDTRSKSTHNRPLTNHFIEISSEQNSLKFD